MEIPDAELKQSREVGKNTKKQKVDALDLFINTPSSFKECYQIITIKRGVYIYIYIFFLPHIYFPASGQAVVIGVVPFSPPGSCLQILSHI